jgi:hypothetical protein
MIDPHSHVQHGMLEGLIRHIPGFRGYLDREERRESDALVRKWMADRLQQCKRGLDDYLRTLVDAGKLDELTQFEQFRSRLDGLINRIRSADRGYSGMFDLVKVGEAELAQVYQLDTAMVNDVTALAESVEQLSSQTDPPKTIAANLNKKVADADQQLTRRGDVLKGLSQH